MLFFFANSHMQYSHSSYYTYEKLNSTVSNCDQSLNDGFSLFHINIRSMPKNIDKLSNFLNLLNTQFTFIAITETWFNDTTSDIYSLDGYCQESVFRSNRRGGGVPFL